LTGKFHSVRMLRQTKGGNICCCRYLSSVVSLGLNPTYQLPGCALPLHRKSQGVFS
jgi:hypothetical protein